MKATQNAEVGTLNAELSAKNLWPRVAAVAALLLMSSFPAFAGRATVQNVTAVQRPTTPIVDIYYDLLNPGGGAHTVTINASTNSGVTYLASSTNFTGAVGAGMTVGTHKQVVWFVERDLPDILTTKARVRVTANDLLADASDMLSIPAGTFTMGNCMNNTEGNSYELPAHGVSVSAFSMDKCEVTKAKWDNVYNWATNHGYAFDYTGAGKSTNHPVYMIDWYNCVQWCNARSEKEGKTPCYYTSAAKVTVYRTWDADIQNDWVDWTANGYRLPTEAEWEFAARGGTPGHRFPWSDANTITNSRANYNSYPPLYTYDLGPQGYNPLFMDGSPFTSPVGYFAPNGYGLYDMAGNVKEWCWDWYDANWYSNAGARQNDPRGPATGGSRVLRGGSWDNDNYAGYCRVSSRDSYGPSYGADDYGFRCVRAVAAASTYSISGSVSGDTQSGVTINLTGAAAASTTTDAGGGYSFSGLANGDYTVTPSKSGYTFAPTSRAVTISGANQTGKDFTATQSGGDGMVLIPAGSFAMGNCMGAGEGWPNELPVHTVMVSAFSMDKYEVTSQKWHEVRNWALANGYTFSNAYPGWSHAATHPVSYISWSDCVKWCNARSEKEGLTPCYYTDSYQTGLYRQGGLNISNECVNWTATGYRLPTEAEWEKAARGGAVGMRFPWSDANTITNSRANYYGDTSHAYDLGPNGFNPLFQQFGIAYSSPVGYFAPNGYGLYDMAGNSREWCWDWYTETYYSSSPASDPHGPASWQQYYPPVRVVRDGGWYYDAEYNRVAYRWKHELGYTSWDIGFRCVRR